MTSSGAAADNLEERLLQLLDRYAQMLRATIARTVRNHEAVEVEDIEQEARIKVWKALQSGRKIAHPTSYLYRVAINAALDALRQVKTRSALICSDEGRPPEPERSGHTTHDSPEKHAATAQALSFAEACVSRLKENRRRAVGLHLQGFTTQEIGSLLGWSEAKARNLVYRGLADLRHCLREKGISYEAD